MRIRTLSIRRDRLADLTPDQMSSVVGASGLPCGLLTSICPTWDCTGCHITCGC